MSGQQVENGYRGGTLEQGSGPTPTTVYCPRCGRPMLIASEHMYVAVACPHCITKLEPWRVAAAGSHDAVTLPHPGRPGHERPQAAIPPPQPMYAPMSPDGLYSWRNRWVAGVLGILLGALGVHRFYLGFVGIGIIQIIVGLCTAGIVSGIWGFIEGILCFCGAMRDVDGRPLRGSVQA